MQTTINAGHNNFTVTSLFGDWVNNTDSDGLARQQNWNTANGSSVCPINYRVPTIDELASETINSGVLNKEDAFNDFLKLPSANYRSPSGNFELGDEFSWRLYMVSITIFNKSPSTYLFSSTKTKNWLNYSKRDTGKPLIKSLSKPNFLKNCYPGGKKQKK